MKTLVINKKHLSLGGIENVVYNLIKFAISQHYRVVWLASNKYVLFRGFNDILTHIEIITSNNKVISRSPEHRSLLFSEDEEVTILSFTPFSHDFALCIKELNPSISIKPLYVLANTKGYLYFIDEYFRWPLSQYVKKKMTAIHQEWDEREEIRYFTQLQRKSLEEKYGITISEPEKKQVPPTIPISSLNEDDLLRRAERKEFNIISISRFSFPHKQYLLGLVDAFALLKPKYSQINLYIIGYGPNEDQLRERINSLPNSIKKDVHMLGQKTNAEIDEIMRNMHLNISVAGSVKCGARNGVVSLPARNYCEGDCEVYGYLPESHPKSSSTEKGLPVIPFIEELINMPKEDYITKCRLSNKTFTSREAHPEYIFEQKVKDTIGYTNNHFFFYIFNKLALFVMTYWKLKRMVKKTHH